MPQDQPRRPPSERIDPNLTVLPAISAPVDEGVLIPRPPRSVWDKVLWIGAVVLLAAAVMAFAFLHATPM